MPDVLGAWILAFDEGRMTDAEVDAMAQNYNRALDQQREEIDRFRAENISLKLQNGELRKALEAIRDHTFVDAEGPELRAQNECNHRRAVEALADKPSREGLCANDRDGEHCLKRAGHEGICEGPNNVWDWKPTLGKQTTIEKRVEQPQKQECGIPPGRCYCGGCVM